MAVVNDRDDRHQECIHLLERLRLGTIATLDRRDFGAVRPAHLSAFTLLP